MLKDIINKITEKPSKPSGKWINGEFVKDNDFYTRSSGKLPDPPFSEEVSNNLKGKEAEKRGDIDTAIKLYERNINNFSDTPFPYTRLAIIYRKQKKYAEEVRVLRIAINVFSKIDRPGADNRLQEFKDRLVKAEELRKGR